MDDLIYHSKSSKNHHSSLAQQPCIASTSWSHIRNRVVWCYYPFILTPLQPPHGTFGHIDLSTAERILRTTKWKLTAKYDINKIAVGHIFGFVRLALDIVFTPSNIKSGFRVTGIFLYNRNVFTDPVFLIAEISDENIEAANDLPCTAGLQETATLEDRKRYHKPLSCSYKYKTLLKSVYSLF